MGAAVEEFPDGLALEGGRPLQGAHVLSHGDHRIAMAFAIAALSAAGESEIEEAECASVSFPEFWQVLEAGRA
jgi:3-phosphoshikimate 1-carboxyvinyltransferase